MVQLCLSVQVLLFAVDETTQGRDQEVRPRLLDLFCREGGAGMGYWLAGFDVVGVDHVKQPRYPFPFFQADAFEFLHEFGRSFDAIHASPPCQAFSSTQQLHGKEHPDLITPLRPILRSKHRPYVIENVEGAPLEAPITLCGRMFGLGTYRHRLFECQGFPCIPPREPEHDRPIAKMGRPPKVGEMMHVVGNFSGVAAGRNAMGMPWATRDGLREAIPPAYTEYIGSELMHAMREQVAA